MCGASCPMRLSSPSSRQALATSSRREDFDWRGTCPKVLYDLPAAVSVPGCDREKSGIVHLVDTLLGGKGSKPRPRLLRLTPRFAPDWRLSQFFCKGPGRSRTPVPVNPKRKKRCQPYILTWPGPLSGSAIRRTREKRELHRRHLKTGRPSTPECRILCRTCCLPTAGHCSSGIPCRTWSSKMDHS